MPKLNSPIPECAKAALDLTYSRLREDVRARARVADMLGNLRLHDLDPMEHARTYRPSARGPVLEAAILSLGAIADGKLVTLSPERWIGQLLEAMGAVVSVLNEREKLVGMDDAELHHALEAAISQLIGEEVKGDCPWPDLQARYAAESRALN